MSEVEVIVVGPAHIGKSTIARVLTRALRAAGLNPSLTDADSVNEERFGQILQAMRGRVVDVKVEQRNPGPVVVDQPRHDAETACVKARADWMVAHEVADAAYRVVLAAEEHRHFRDEFEYRLHCGTVDSIKDSHSAALDAKSALEAARLKYARALASMLETVAVSSSGVVELDEAMRCAKHALFQRARKLDPDTDTVDISFCIEQLQKVDELSPRLRGL